MTKIGSALAVSRSLLLRWFLFPSTDLSILADRHEAVACFSMTTNLPSADDLSTALKGIANVPNLVKRLHEGRVSIGTWKGIVNFCLRLLHMRELMTQLRGGHGADIIRRFLAEVSVPELQGVAESVDATIDWEQSNVENRVCIKPCIDTQLDEWRDLYAGLPSFLANVVQKLHVNYTFPEAGRINVVYFPQLGFLVAMRCDDTSQEPQDFQVPVGWDFHFASNTSAYYKSPEMRDLDHHVGDLHSFIADREVEIAHQLSVAVGKAGVRFVRLAELCAELDW